MTTSLSTIRHLRLVPVAILAAIAVAGPATGSTGSGVPPQSAIDAASANWAAKAKLLDRYGQPKLERVPPQSAIDAASANWAAKARLLGEDGRPLIVSHPQRGDATTGAFDWADFGIGGAAMLGLVLLAGGLAVGVRTARHSGTRQPSPVS